MTRADLLELRPPRIAMSLALVAVAAHLFATVPLHPSLPFAGALTAAAGFALMLRAWWLFRIAGTAICPTERATSLITKDVFAITRNPMYLGMTMMLAGFALCMGTLPFYIAATGFFAFIDRVFCPFEEQKSEQEFGARFRTYRQRVRRWL